MTRALSVLLIAAALAFSLNTAWAQDVAQDKTPAKAVEKAAEKTETKSVLAVPDTSKISFIENLRAIGAKVYFMGEALGMNSWLILKDKQIQILYTSPDQRAVLVGALLSAEGANVSQQQILMLAGKEPEVAAVLNEAQGATVKVAEEKHEDPAPIGDSPAEQLYGELDKATRVTFGKAEAPMVYMFMDVHCPHCHEAWKMLEKYVDQGRLRISMVPINALGTQSQVDAANWLNKKDPLDAWRKYMAGDENALKIGNPDTDKERAVYDNTRLAARWKIDRTPYFFYKGKNGKVRTVMGIPKDVDALLSDVK